MATPKKKKTGEGLYKKRFATLKEHRAAVAARKALKAGKNVGPVANADAYGSAIKPKTTPKAATPKTTPKKSTPKAATPKAATPKTATTTKAETPTPKVTQHRGGQRASAGRKIAKTPATPKRRVTAAERQRQRRSSSTSQSRAENARRRGLANNLREMREAARKRAHKNGVFKSSYNRR